MKYLFEQLNYNINKQNNNFYFILKLILIGKR